MKILTRAFKSVHRGVPAGFTLLELVVVLVIAGALVAIATPASITWMRERGTHDAADQLAYDLQRAKLLAIQRNTNCSVTIDLPANQYTLSITNEIVDLGTYAGNVMFSNNPDASAAVITFTPQGICQAFGAVYLTNQQGYRYRIRATAAGAVSVHLFSNGQWV